MVQSRKFLTPQTCHLTLFAKIKPSQKCLNLQVAEAADRVDVLLTVAPIVCGDFEFGPSIVIQYFVSI